MNCTSKTFSHIRFRSINPMYTRSVHDFLNYVMMDVNLILLIGGKNELQLTELKCSVYKYTNLKIITLNFEYVYR